MINKIEVINKNEDGAIYPTTVKLNGEELNGVRKFTYEIGVDECPTATIELAAISEIGSPAMLNLKNVKDLLKQVNTCDLVSELRKREGVESEMLEPYVEKDLGIVSGPAIILTIVD